MAEESETDDAPAAPWTQPRFVVAGVGLGLIAVLGFVLVISGPAGRGAAEPGPGAGPGAAAPPEEPATGPDASVCGLEDGEQNVLAVAPPGTRWELVGTMAAPTAPGVHGPGLVEDGYRSCFAHSPTGALYAAAGFWALATAKPAGDVLERLAAETAARPRAIRVARAAAGDQPVLGGTTTLQIAGFRFVAYDRDAATVDLAARVSSGGLASLPSRLRWQDGDWKYVVPANGDSGIRQIPSLVGYAAWAGA